MVPIAGEEASWTAAVAGDAEAFASIFERHRGRVYRQASRLTGNIHDAEDLTAGAFLELWRRRASVRVVDGSVLPWLLVTTTNLCHNLERGLRRYRHLIDTLPRSEAAPSADELALEQLCDDRTRQLREAFYKLSPADATLIGLVALEELSPAQAAAALGISDGAARARLHRAQSRLARVLDAQSPAETTGLTWSEHP